MKAGCEKSAIAAIGSASIMNSLGIGFGLSHTGLQLG
jgi:hypothetical protein